jgi:predicted RecA/RadA family phage recombinase
MASTRADGDVIDYTPTTGVAAGEAVVVGSIVGIASRPIVANELGALNVEGVFSVAKPTGAGTAIAQGAKVYLYQSQAVTGATGTVMGFAAKAAATTDSSVDVLLGPGA